MGKFLVFFILNFCLVLASEFSLAQEIPPPPQEKEASSEPEKKEEEGPPQKIFERPYFLSAGLSLGVGSLNGADVQNGGKADLGAITSGLRFEFLKKLKKVEHQIELDLRLLAFSSFQTTRLINLSQIIYPGVWWQTRFLNPRESITWIAGGGIHFVPYYSTLDGYTVKMDGALSISPYGGARIYLPGLESIYLQYAEAHIGLEYPLVTKNYRGSLGFWQRLRIDFEKPWGDSQKRWLEGWIDITHGNESTNRESQSQMGIAFWILAKWEFETK